MSEPSIRATTLDPELASFDVPAIDLSQRSFAGRVAFTFATRLSMVVGGLGSSVVVARWLGAEGLGFLAVVNVTVALALQVGSAGLPSATTYFVAKDRRNVPGAAANALIFAVIAGAALALAVIGLSALRPALFGNVPTRLIAIAAISIPSLLVMLLGLNLLLGIDKVVQFNLLDAAAPLLVLVNAVVVLIILQAGLYTLVAFNTAATVLICFVTIWAVTRNLSSEPGSLWRPSLKLFKSMAGYGVKFYISIMAGVIIFRSDLLIVNHFRGAAEAGVYAVASQMGMLLMMLPAVIATLLFPRVAAASDISGEFAMQVTRHTSGLMFLICLLAVPAAFAIPIVYGVSFNEAVVLLLILLPGVYFISVESVIVQHFTGTGLPAAIPIFWIITVVVNVGLNLIFVPAFGARAAAVNSVVSYTLIFALVAFYFCRRTKNRLSSILLPRPHELHELLKRFTPDTRPSIPKK